MRYHSSSTEPFPAILDPVQVAKHARVEEDDEMLDVYTKAALYHAEQICNQPLFARSRTVNVSGFYSRGTLPGINPRDVSVAYDTTIAPGVILDASGYRVVNGYFQFNPEVTSSLSPTGAIITYTAGWTSEDVPENVAIALYNLVTQFYDNRGNPVQEKRTLADLMLQPYKIESV